LEVDGNAIDMRYFLKRVAMSGEPSLTTLQALTKEQIIKQSVTKSPYDLAVTDQEIDQFARNIARGKSKTISEGEFKEWYRQQLNESRLSDAEFRDLLKTRLLSLRMSKYLGDRVPTVAEQVFVHMFPIKDLATGREVKQKLDAGEEFAVLAQAYSVDPKLKESGGVVGWIPRGVLDPGFDKVAFELEIGQTSEPMFIDKHTVVVIVISDKVAARQIDPPLLEVLKAKALDKWLQEQKQYHTVEYRGFKNGYDTETDAWVQWQLQRMKR
jgi:parvulin-like peptidyl-prolyl isomerase